MNYAEDVTRERALPVYRVWDDRFWYGAVAAVLLVSCGSFGYKLHSDSMQVRRTARAPFVFPEVRYASPLTVPLDSELVSATATPTPEPETHAARIAGAFTHSKATQLAGLILPDYQHPKSYETTSTSLSAKGERVFNVRIGNESGKYVLSVVMKPGAQTPTPANASSVQIGALENVGNNTWRDVYDLTAGPEGYSASGVAALSRDWNCGFSPTDPITPNAATAQKVFVQAADVERLIANNQSIGFQSSPAA